MFALNRGGTKYLLPMKHSNRHESTRMYCCRANQWCASEAMLLAAFTIPINTHKKPAQIYFLHILDSDFKVQLPQATVTIALLAAIFRELF